ncbi:MAG: hypothetical protein JRJ62_01495 [Deltaproteobacteria bacterium]|nr:hypothetical protein [Deltaproteobacteria bacterium]
MKVLITSPFHPDSIEKLRENGLDVVYESWMEVNKLYVGEQLVEKINQDQIDILVIEADVLNELVFEKTKGKLKYVAACRANPTNVDIEAATKVGVPVSNSPGRGGPSVAELAIGIMICLMRHLHRSDHVVKSKKWTEQLTWATTYRGITFENKVVGIVSLGAVGYEVAKRLQNWDCKIIVYDPYVSEEKLKSVNASRVDLPILMRESDIVTVHAPVLDETKGMITEELIGMMKKTAFFINTSRTAIINEKAVVKAVKEERIAGAGFDVYYKEPLGRTNYFKEFFFGGPHADKNVVFGAHIGGMTWDSIKTQSEIVTRDILAFMKGEKPPNLLNLEVWNK